MQISAEISLAATFFDFFSRPYLCLVATILFIQFPLLMEAQVTVSNAHPSSNGSYATLYAAFAAINAQTQTGYNISVSITADVTEATNYPSLNGGAWSSLTVSPSGGAWRIFGNYNGSLIRLNGADNVTFDGINSGGNSLTIENSNTGTAATCMDLYNNTSGCTNITLTRCTFLGSTGYASGAYDKRGVISFTGSSYTCENVTITYNNIGSSGSNCPASGINITYYYSSSNNVNISNNNIYNFYAGGGSNSNVAAGIYLGRLSHDINNTNYTINGNSFYFTIPITANAGQINAIYIHKGNNFTITNNYFGGSAPTCGGSASSINGSTYTFGFLHVDGHSTYMGLPYNSGSNTLSNNVMSNINFYSSNATVPSDYFDGTRFYFCSIHSGLWSINSNTVGSMSSNDNIVIEDVNQGKYFLFHIYGGISTSNGPIVSSLSSNQAGGITINSVYSNLEIVNVSISNTDFISMIYSLNNNVFGSSLSQSIKVPLATNSSTYFTGIRLSGFLSGVQMSANNNTIQNVSYNQGSVYGMSTYRDVIIKGNTIRNLSTTSGAKAIGVNIGSNDNYFYSEVSRNLVTDLYSPTEIQGLSISSYYNPVLVASNVVVLGGDISSNALMYGIYQYYKVNIYGNTVYMEGTGTSGTSNSYAYYRHSFWASTTNVQNNVFVNARSNSGATGTHYAAYFGSTTSLTVNYNNYRATGTGGMLGYYSGNIATLPNANLGSSSISLDPGFVNPGSATGTDYRPTVSMNGVSGTGVVFDFAGATRPSTPTMGAMEYGLNKWIGSYSNDFATAGNWSYGEVPVSGESIAFDPAAANHCVLDQNRTLGSIADDVSGRNFVLNGHELVVNGNLQFSNSAMINGTATGSALNISGSSSQTLPSNGFVSGVLSELKINNSNGVYLGSDLVLNDSLVFGSGLLHTTTYYLTLADNAGCNGAGSGKYINGYCRKTGNDAFVFPVGHNGLYSPIGISAPSQTTDQFTCWFRLESPDPLYDIDSKDVSLDHVCNTVYWMLNQTAGSSPVNVTMYWTTCNGISIPADVRVARWNGTLWEDEGNSAWVGDANSGYVTSDPISSFSPFTFASVSAGNSLPVSWLSVDAIPVDQNIDVLWSTASEMNNDYFTVEHSIDLVRWEELGQKSANGNSNVVVQYSFTDFTPEKGMNYYRIRQNDFDGSESWSDIVAVMFGVDNSMHVWPVPATDVIHIDGLSDAVSLISVFNVEGVLVMQTESRSIDIQHLPAGVYWLQAETNDGYIGRTRFIRQ